jgi:hypothetical protein
MATLINDIGQLKSVLGGVQKTMNWATWEPFVRQARYAVIEKTIGEAFYIELSAIVNPTGSALGLIERLRNAEGYYAYSIAFPQLIMVTGDAGIAVSTPDKTQAMGKWMYINTIKQLSLKADMFLEESLDYLERHKSEFPTWKNSLEYSMSHQSFLSSAGELSLYLPSSKNSRRFYLAIKQHISNCEDFTIKNLIGENLYKNWKNRLLINSNVWTSYEFQALRYLRFCLANHAFAECIPFMNISDDFRIISETDGILNEDILSEARRNELKYKCESDAAAYASELIKYLDRNCSEDIFPEYFLQKFDKNKGRKRYESHINDPLKTYVVL